MRILRSPRYSSANCCKSTQVNFHNRDRADQSGTQEVLPKMNSSKKSDHNTTRPNPNHTGLTLHWAEYYTEIDEGQGVKKKIFQGYETIITGLVHIQIQQQTAMNPNHVFIIINPYSKRAIDIPLEGGMANAMFWCEGWIAGQFEKPISNIHLHVNGR